MATEKDKLSAITSTKVRTRLRDDGSWLQRRIEPQADTEEEEVKPWVAEVRASRVNGAPAETSPVPSPTKATPPPAKPDAERAPTSGYLIRGVFTKLNNKPASSSTSNGVSGATQFSKKPSESYKKIAPHTVRPTSENQEIQFSSDEQEKRTEAASNVLKKSAVRQRSYVFSAAQKYESREKVPDTPPVNSSASFVAKRVEIFEDDDGTRTPTPVGSPSPPPSPAPPTVASAPKPTPRRTVETSVTPAVDEPVPPKVQKTAPELVEGDTVPPKAPFEGMKPGCTKVATPLPELLLPVLVQAEPELEDSEDSDQADTSLVKLTPAFTTLVSTAPAAPAPVSPVLTPSVPKSPAPVSPVLTPTVPKSPAPVSPVLTPTVPKSPAPVSPILTPTVPKSPAPVSPVLTPTVPKSPAPVSPILTPTVPKSPAPVSPILTPTVPKSPAPVSPVLTPTVPESPGLLFAATAITVKSNPELEEEPEPEPEPTSQLSPKPRSSVHALAAMYDTLVPFDTSSTSLKDEEPEQAEEEEEEEEEEDSHATENSVATAPALSNCEPLTDDLLALDNGPGGSAEPVPPSPGRWSQDLLSGLDSEADPAKASGAMDLLADDVIPINTEARSLSVRRREWEPTDETAKGTQSSLTETVTVTTKTLIITDRSEEDNSDPWSSRVTTVVTESSSADPFDPYPIGTTSPNSSSDLLQPLADIPINSAQTTFLEKQDPSPEVHMSGSALSSLADDVVPIDTHATSLSTRRSWARTWETVTPQQINTDESPGPEPEDQAGDQQTLIKFERKSSENDSPWDRWTSPTVYTIATEEDEEEEEEEESPEDTHTQTVTTVTTIREMHSEPEPVMDRHLTSYSSSTVEEERRVPTPEPEPSTKKAFVYLKEYVNATELSSHNARDTDDSGSDYFTSSSTNYSYSSPSSYRVPLSSTCTYCGAQVNNDAKITIEHLNINCHPDCFKCAVCSKPMGDLLCSMFLHGGKVHCESCYSKASD